jgi:hypothetical protein
MTSPTQSRRYSHNRRPIVRFAGSLSYGTEKGERHLLAKFDVDATDVALPRKLVLDAGWDHRLASASCVPVIKYATGASAADEREDKSPKPQTG